MKINALVTVNNDFWIMSEAICQWLKIIVRSLHEWPKIVIRGNECIILFLTRYFMSRTQIRQNNYWSLNEPLSPKKVFSNLVLWRPLSWSVTSCERGVLTLWRHIRRLFLHAKNGSKAIFTSEKQPWISISHQPVFTAMPVGNQGYCLTLYLIPDTNRKYNIWFNLATNI